MVRGSVDARAVPVYSRAAIDRALRQLLLKLACRLALCRPRLGLIRYSPLKQMTTRNVALIHRPVERKSPSFDACLTRRCPKPSESLGRRDWPAPCEIGSRGDINTQKEMPNDEL
jgi:hypothetical protein